jgi:hypothetical protein
VVLTPRRLGGFPFHLSDPSAMVLRFLVGVMRVRHHETVPPPGVHKLKSGDLIGAGSIPITIACFSTAASSIDCRAQILSPPSGMAHNVTLADQHHVGCLIQWRRLDTTLMTSATITAP